ncbi:MAG: hypothetical protein ACOCZ5_03765 [bacterium]
MRCEMCDRNLHANPGEIHFMDDDVVAIYINCECGEGYILEYTFEDFYRDCI